MSEHRQSLRIPCDIILNKIQDGHTNVVRAINISLGGIRIQRLLEPLLGDARRTRLQFVLPGTDEVIWAGARPVYEENTHVGFEFTNLSHQNFVKLRNWILEQR